MGFWDISQQLVSLGVVLWRFNLGPDFWFSPSDDDGDGAGVGVGADAGMQMRVRVRVWGYSIERCKWRFRGRIPTPSTPTIYINRVRQIPRTLTDIRPV